MTKRLYRSKRNRMISGVCGGLSEYLRIDPTLIRIAWILFGAFGAGIIAYIVAAIIIPDQKDEFGSSFTDNSSMGTDNDVFERDTSWDNVKGNDTEYYDPDKSKLIIGIGLIIFGVMFLARQFFHWFDMRLFWPVAFILIGFLIIYKGRRNQG